MAAAAIPIFAAIIGTATSAAMSHEQRVDANKARRKQENERKIAEGKLKDKELQNAQLAAAQKLKGRQNVLGTEAEGRQGTILTSPLGVSDPYSGAGKTILGT